MVMTQLGRDRRVPAVITINRCDFPPRGVAYRLLALRSTLKHRVKSSRTIAFVVPPVAEPGLSCTS